MKITQQQRILGMLGDGRWHSSREFLRAYIPRYSARIHELQKQGWVLERRMESKEKAIETRMYEWRLIGREESKVPQLETLMKRIEKMQLAAL